MPLIEVVIGRGFAIRVNGKRPDDEFRIIEDRLDDATKYIMIVSNKHQLEFGDHTVRWIEFDTPHTEWISVLRIDRGHRIIRHGPEVARGLIDGIVRPLTIEEVWWPIPEDFGPSPKGVMMTGGDWVEVDENMAYVRLSTKE
jgi:hypothetical protein